jgi:hypothetical protein
MSSTHLPPPHPLPNVRKINAICHFGVSDEISVSKYNWPETEFIIIHFQQNILGGEGAEV